MTVTRCGLQSLHTIMPHSRQWCLRRVTVQRLPQTRQEEEVLSSSHSTSYFSLFRREFRLRRKLISRATRLRAHWFYSARIGFIPFHRRTIGSIFTDGPVGGTTFASRRCSFLPRSFAGPFPCARCFASMKLAIVISLSFFSGSLSFQSSGAGYNWSTAEDAMIYSSAAYCPPSLVSSWAMKNDGKPTAC